MNLLTTLLTILAAYPIIKEILKDIQKVSQQKEKWELRYTLWKQNRKSIFTSLVLIIIFLLLSLTALIYTIAGFFNHNIVGTILFSIVTILFIYYLLLFISSTIIKVVLILRAK